MEKRSRKYYPSKDIVIAYITTINPDSYTVEGEIVKSVLALRKQKYNKNDSSLIPIEAYFPYYSIDYMIPISKKMEKSSAFITNKEIEKIIEKEKQLQKVLKTPEIEVVELPQNKQSIEAILNELELDKVKKLVA